jgi:CHAT domain-containing protein/Tfp pilus assembly protein PilF
LDVRAQVFGEHHPKYADSLDMLAAVYMKRGEFTKAEPLRRKSFEITRDTLGEKHPDYAVAMNNLAVMYDRMGDNVQAVRLQRQALQLYRRAFGDRHLNTAQALANLAGDYISAGEYAAATPLLNEAIEIRSKLLSPTHPDVAMALERLGTVHLFQKQYDQAEQCYRRSYEICKQSLPPGHRYLARGEYLLGLLYHFRGEYAKAEPYYLRSMEMTQQAVGARHAIYVTGLSNLGILYESMEQFDEAERYFDQALSIKRDLIEDSLETLGERQLIQAIAEARIPLDGLISATLNAGRDPTRHYPHVLFWKGLALRTRAEASAATPENKQLLDRLLAVRRELTRMALAAPSDSKQRRVAQVENLLREKENLENELVQSNREAAAQFASRSLSSNDIARSLSPGSIFVDFFEYGHHSQGAPGRDNYRNQHRMLGFVTPSGGTTLAVALADANRIQSEVNAVRRALVSGTPEELDHARQILAESVWRPLGQGVELAKSVIIAPDGPLTQIPFALLPGRTSPYLLEDMAITYLPSARQLIASQPATPAADRFLALGEIQYGQSALRFMAPGQLTTAITKLALPGTSFEIRHSAESFHHAFPKTEATLLVGAAANKQRLFEELKQPAKFIHFATHGFYLPPRISARPATELIVGTDASRGFVLEQQPHSDLDDDQSLSILMPRLYSGLLLAPPEDHGTDQGEDDFLTAEEVMSLDLQGTQVVTLSACETGLGSQTRGQGVIGLQRAFHAAGAETVIGTLWRVDDAATSLLVERFYANLWEKQMSREEALRQAQLSILNHPDDVARRRQALGSQSNQPAGTDKDAASTSHPALWAAFVLSGRSE